MCMNSRYSSTFNLLRFLYDSSSDSIPKRILSDEFILVDTSISRILCIYGTSRLSFFVMAIFFQLKGMFYRFPNGLM